MPPIRTDEYRRWATANLVSNIERGKLAEYLVATACGATGDGYEAWWPYDVETPDGCRIEVKSAAYLQSWKVGTIRATTQDIPTFTVGAPTQWSDENGSLHSATRQRWSHLHVFALWNHTDLPTADPADTDQWVFYILPTATLNAMFGSKEGRLRVTRMTRLGAAETGWEGVRQAVAAAYNLLRTTEASATAH